MKNFNADQINEIIGKVGSYKSFQILPDFKQKAVQKRIASHLNYCENETRMIIKHDPAFIRRTVEEAATEQKTWVRLQKLKREKATNAKQPKKPRTGGRVGFVHFALFAAAICFVMQIFS